MTTLVGVTVVFRYLYHPRFGLLDRALGWVGIAPINWLGDPHWAMAAIILLAVWKNFGYAMILFVAGLGNIPESLLEAAKIDGAGRSRASGTSRCRCSRRRFSSSGSRRRSGTSSSSPSRTS